MVSVNVHLYTIILKFESTGGRIQNQRAGVKILSGCSTSKKRIKSCFRCQNATRIKGMEINKNLNDFYLEGNGRWCPIGAQWRSQGPPEDPKGFKIAIFLLFPFIFTQAFIRGAGVGGKLGNVIGVAAGFSTISPVCRKGLYDFCTGLYFLIAHLFLIWHQRDI